MKGRKGHLIEFKNKKPSEYNYLMRVSIGSSRISYYMHSSRILMGLTSH